MAAPVTQEPPRIKTRLLIISDTHGTDFSEAGDHRYSADVVIHCGNLTENSTLAEFLEAIQMLRLINAPLKLVIAGKHDFSLDIPVFTQRVAEAEWLSGGSAMDRIHKEFGDCGDALKILQQAQKDGIVFLDEGPHEFHLQNGAILSVYASPFTPSTGGNWGFQYRYSHHFDVRKCADVLITHGPPRGVLDASNGERLGCRHLFAAVAAAQPKVHCFGHVKSGWGAKLVTWRPNISHRPSHFRDVDHERSKVLETLATLGGSSFESAENRDARQQRMEQYQSQGSCNTSHCNDDPDPLGPGQTLFVNAAIKSGNGMTQFPWLVDIDLEPQPQVTNETKNQPGANLTMNDPFLYAMYGIETENKLKRSMASPEAEQGGERPRKRARMMDIHQH